MNPKLASRTPLILFAGLFLLLAFLYLYHSSSNQLRFLAGPRPFSITTGKWLNSDQQKPLQDFQFITPNGKWTSFSKFAGDSPVLLVFWRTDCPACIEEFAQIEKLKENKSLRDLKMLGINVDPSFEVVKRFANKRFIPLEWGWDQDGLAARGLGIRGVPTVWVVNEEGNVVYQGFVLPARFEKLVDAPQAA